MRAILSIGAICAMSLGLSAGSAFAASAVQKECAQKYQAAKAANTLNGATWNQYYKQCAAQTKAGGAAAAPTATPAAAPAAPAPAPAAPAPTAAAPAAPAAAGAAVFPAAVSPTYSKESAGKARMHTCLDQYKANKATNANGGLKWIEKGGGYYSECNKRLKG